MPWRSNSFSLAMSAAGTAVTCPTSLMRLPVASHPGRHSPFRRSRFTSLPRMRCTWVFDTPTCAAMRGPPSPSMSNRSTSRIRSRGIRAPLYASPPPGGGNAAFPRLFRSAAYRRRCSAMDDADMPRRSWISTPFMPLRSIRRRRSRASGVRRPCSSRCAGVKPLRGHRAISTALHADASQTPRWAPIRANDQPSSSRRRIASSSRSPCSFVFGAWPMIGERKPSLWAFTWIACQDLSDSASHAPGRPWRG